MVECEQRIGPYVDDVGLALHVKPPPPLLHYKTPIEGGVFDVVDRRWWVFVVKSVV